MNWKALFGEISRSLLFPMLQNLDTQLAEFESTVSYLFNIRFNGKRYEKVSEEDDLEGESAMCSLKIMN